MKFPVRLLSESARIIIWEHNSISNSAEPISKSQDTCDSDQQDPYDFTVQQTTWNVITWVFCILTAVSLAAGVFMMIGYVVSRQLRSFVSRLIFFLALSDCLALMFLMPVRWTSYGDDRHYLDDTDGWFCQTQAGMIQTFLQSTCWWSAALAFVVYRMVVRNDSNVDRFEWALHGLCWCFPLCTALVCAAFGWYKRWDLWCWIDPEMYPVQVLLYWLPISCCYGIVVYCTLAVKKHLKSRVYCSSILPSEQPQDSVNHKVETPKRRMSGAEFRAAESIVKRLYRLCIVFLTLWLPVFVHAGIGFAWKNEPLWSTILCTPVILQCTCNFIIFGANARFWIELFARRPTDEDSQQQEAALLGIHVAMFPTPPPEDSPTAAERSGRRVRTVSDEMDALFAPTFRESRAVSDAALTLSEHLSSSTVAGYGAVL